MRRRLFIPGPTEVRAEILQALATPQIGHRRLKDGTFRTDHMGDVETWELRGVLSAIDRILGTPSA